MRLYSRIGATAVTDAGAVYKAGADAAFEFPAEVSERLHGFAANGQPLWEDDAQRQRRLIAEEIDRRKDPATLLDAVEQLVAAAQATRAPAPEPAVAKAPAKPEPAKTPAKTAAAKTAEK